jgi:site-specific DNA-methyltransferase (adenine-specific)
MRYLVRMVTPPGGVVLDPFMGSGSTGCAAVREGFDFVGIDLTPEYVAIAQKRIDWHAVTSPLDNVATMELHEENDA